MSSLKHHPADVGRLWDTLGTALPYHRGTAGEAVFAVGGSSLTYLRAILRDDPADFVRRSGFPSRYLEDNRPITAYSVAVNRTSRQCRGQHAGLASIRSSPLAFRRSSVSRTTPTFMPYRRSQGLGATCRYCYIGRVKKR